MRDIMNIDFPKEISDIMEDLKDHCSKGHSLFSFMGKAGMSFEEWNRLVEKYPQTKKHIEIAQSHQANYWEECLTNAVEAQDTKAATIASKVLSDMAKLYKDVYKKNISTTRPDEMIKRRIENAAPIRNRDILDI